MGFEKCCNKEPEMLSSDEVNPRVYINIYKCNICKKVYKYRVIFPFSRGEDQKAELIKLGDEKCLME